MDAVKAAIAELEAKRATIDAAISALRPLVDEPSATSSFPPPPRIGPEAAANLQRTTARAAAKAVRSKAPRKANLRPADAGRLIDRMRAALEAAGRPMTGDELQAACGSTLGTIGFTAAKHVRAGNLVRVQKGTYGLPGSAPAPATPSGNGTPIKHGPHRLEKRGDLLSCVRCFEQFPAPTDFPAICDA